MSVRDRKLQGQNSAGFATLEKLLEVGQSLIVVRDLGSLLQKIAESAGSVLEADVIVLYEYQEEMDDVTVPPITWGDVWYPEVLGERGCVHKESLVFKMLERTEPFYASDAGEDWAQLIEEWPQEGGESESFIHREGIASSAAISLAADDERVGVLFVNYRSPRVFDDEARKTIELFATQAAIAIRNANLFDEERQRADVMDLLRRVSATISTPLDIKKALALIVQGAVQLTNTDAGVIHLIDDAGQAISHSHEFPEGSGHLASRFAQKTGLTWEAFDTEKIVKVFDVPQSRRVSSALARSGVESVIGVPLNLRGRVIGVLFLNSFKRHDFTADEKATLTMLAEQATIAIQNARLFEQLQEELLQTRALYDIGQALSAELDHRSVLQLILSKAGGIIPFEHGSVNLIDERLNRLVMKSSIGLPRGIEPVRTKIGEGITGWVAKYGHPLCVADVKDIPEISDVPEQPGYVLPVENIRSELCVPLRIKGEIIGVLNVESPQVGAFNKKDQDQLETLASQAAIAIENSRLFQALDERAKQLEQLQKVTAKISAEPSDLDKALRLIVDSLDDIFPAASCTIRLYDSKADEFEPKVAIGLLEDLAEAPPRTDGVSRYVVRTKEPRYLVGDDLITPPDEGPAVREDIRDLGVKSTAHLPLISKGDVIGILYVDLTTPYEFSLNDKLLLELFADQAATAIENARLYEQRAKDIAALQEINAAITTAPWREVARLIARQAKDLMQAEYSGLWMVEGDRLVLGAMYGREAKVEEKAPPEELPIDEYSINGLVAKTGEPYVCTDARNDPHYLRWRRDIQSSMAVPLKSREQLIGTLCTESANLGAFSDYQVELLQSLANQAAIAIKNARLFEEAERHANKLAALYETGQAITSVLELDALLQLITERSAQLTRADKALILLVDAEAEELTQVVGSGFTPGQIESFTYQEVQDGISGWVLRKGKPTISKDILTDSRNTGLALQMARKERERAKSVAVAPLSVKGKVIGTLTAVNDVEKPVFSQDDLDLVTMLANQAAIAIENARLYEQLHQANKQLKRKVDNLSAVNEVGQTLTSRIGLSEEQILELIYEQATPLMDTSDMYIALYEPDPDRPDEYNLEAPGKSVIHGTVRFGLAMGNGRRVDVGHEEGWEPRKAGRGLTEVVIRTKQSFLPNDVKAMYDRPNVEEYIGKIPESWMGVPMTVEDEVVGVVVLRNDERENVYDEDDLEVLQTIASQSAIAIQNARLVQQLKQRVKELDTLRELAEELSAGVLPDTM